MSAVPGRFLVALGVGACLAALGMGALVASLSPAEEGTSRRLGAAERIDPAILDRPDARALAESAMRSTALLVDGARNATPPDAPRAQQPLWRLTGILSTTNGERVAVFSLGPGQAAKALRVSESTPDGRRIESIDEQHVTLIDPSTQCEEQITLFNTPGTPPCRAENGTTEASSQ